MKEGGVGGQECPVPYWAGLPLPHLRVSLTKLRPDLGILGGPKEELAACKEVDQAYASGRGPGTVIYPPSRPRKHLHARIYGSEPTPLDLTVGIRGIRLI